MTLSRHVTLSRRAAGLFGAVFLLTACGDGLNTSPAPTAAGKDCVPASDQREWSEIEKAATGEGSVAWYTSLSPDINDRLKVEFERTHPGVTLDVTRAQATTLTQRIDAEASGGAESADVVTHTEPVWQKSHGTNFFTALAGPAANAIDQKQLLSVSNTSALTALSVIGYAWNTTVVDQPPANFEDIVNPRYRGKLGLYDYQNDVGAISFALWAKQYGNDFADGLGKLEPRFYPGGSQIAQALAAGEIGITAYVTPSLIPPNAPVKVAFPDSPVAVPYFSSVLCSANHGAAAQVLADWLVTPEAQKISAVGSASVLQGRPDGTDLAVSDVQLVDVGAYRAEELDNVRAGLDKSFSR